MKGSQFQLVSDTLATYFDDCSRDRLVLIPAGTEITLLDESLDVPSIRVSWNGCELAVFSEVLRSQAIALEGEGYNEPTMLDEIEDEEEDLSVAEKLRLVDQLLALSKQCWSRSLRSFDGEFDAMRKSLLDASASEKAFGAAAGEGSVGIVVKIDPLDGSGAERSR